MSALEEARELILAAELPDELVEYGQGAYVWDGQYSDSIEELTPESLATSFGYQIKLDGTRIKEEASVPLGSSKYRGLPHLPPDMDWPEELYFAAQINLTDLAKVDRSGRLPTSGMLYFFFNGAAEDAVIHWDGDVSKLEVREYPNADSLPNSEYYLDDFLRGETLDLQPYWLFHLNHGDAYDYHEVQNLVPQDLSAALTDLLGCGTTRWNPTCRMYGRPLYWQGEDEGGGWPVDFDEDGQPIFEDEDATPELLLFQDEFGEGNIHFWCDADAAKAGNFSESWVGYSGT